METAPSSEDLYGDLGLGDLGLGDLGDLGDLRDLYDSPQLDFDVSPPILSEPLPSLPGPLPSLPVVVTGK